MKPSPWGSPSTWPAILPPIDVAGMSLEVTPPDYAHVVQSNGESRTITVRSRSSALTYSGLRLRASRNR